MAVLVTVDYEGVKFKIVVPIKENVCRDTTWDYEEQASGFQGCLGPGPPVDLCTRKCC